MKMLKVGYFLVFVLMLSVEGIAQNVLSGSGATIYLSPMGGSEENHLKKGSYVGPHFFGDSLTMKKSHFESLYVYFKTGKDAYAVEEKIVKKPSIYKAINKIDDALTKEAKDNATRFYDNKNRLDDMYDIGIKLMRYRTDDVEGKLKKIKDPKELEQFLRDLRFN